MNVRVSIDGTQVYVRPDEIQVATVVHRTSREDDPHRHVHYQLVNKARLGDKWYSFDTAELVRYISAVNRVGERVIRSDENLLRVLQEKGYHFDQATGKIAELEPYAEAFSKRSLAIAERRAEILAEWQEAHQGEIIGRELLNAIDHQAWALTRPEKASEAYANEDSWRAELEAMGFVAPDSAVSVQYIPVSRVNAQARQEYAREIVEELSAGHSSWNRSMMTALIYERLGQYRISGSPDDLAQFADDVLVRAEDLCVGVDEVCDLKMLPSSFAGYTSPRVVAEEEQLRRVYAEMGASVPVKRMVFADGERRFSGELSIGDIRELFEVGDYRDVEGKPVILPTSAEHWDALCHAGGTAQLTTIIGPAGSGKTTLLSALKVLTEAQGGNLHVLAPSGKAAMGAQEETGAHGGTLHKFLMAYGYSFETDEETGVTTWGERDKNKPVPGEWLLGHNDVLVVDEAGMMTQDVALRLNQIVRETGVRVRMVGDYRQLAAVGRGGILQMTEQKSHSTDLRDIFRFKTDEGELDKAYAELTLQIREGRDPQVAFDELVKRGLVVLHESMEDAQEALAEAWVDSYESGEKCVIATARNEDVTSINRHVGILRAETEPEIEPWDDTAEEDILTGRDGLKISVDDVIATRKNNAGLGVLNRQTWRVQEITEGYLVAVSTEDRAHRVALPLDYVNEYVDMAYAITGHGSQGMTVDRAHTLVTEATNAGGLYVGVSRGKYSNEVHFVAADLDEAYEQFAGALKKDRADNGLDSVRAELVEQLREAGLLPQFEREGLNVRASDVKPGQVLSFGASEKLVLDSQRSETGEYKFRVLDKATKKPQWTVPVPEKIHFPYLNEVSLPLPKSVQKQIQAVQVEAQKIESAMDYVHEVREWELDHVREFDHIESSEKFVQAYTDQLHAVEQELAQAQRAYEESLQIRENHLAQPAQVLTQAQEAFESAGVFRRTFGKVTGDLEEAQLAWDKACEAYPVPSDAEVEQLQSRVRVIQSQIDENARYRDETRAGLMSSLPVAPAQAQKFLRGSGVEVELAEGVEARFREDRADLVRLYSLEPEYRANLVNAELPEPVKAGAVKKPVRVQQEPVHQVDFLEQQRLMSVTVGGVQDGAEM